MKNWLSLIFPAAILSLMVLPAPSQTTPTSKTRTSTGYTTQSGGVMPQTPPRALAIPNPGSSNSVVGLPPGMTNQFSTNGLIQDVMILSRNLQADVMRLQPLLVYLGGQNISLGASNDFNASGNGGTVSQSGQNFGTIGGTNLSTQSGQNLSSSAAVAPGTPPIPPAPTIPGPAYPSTGGSFPPAAAGSAANANQNSTGSPYGAASGGGTGGAAQLGADDLAVINEVQIVLQDFQANSQQLLPRLAQLSGTAAGGIGGQYGTNSGRFGQPPVNGSGVRPPAGTVAPR